MSVLAILTSGGDAPGMNMAVWAATRAARGLGWPVRGVCEGFGGLLRGDLIPLEPALALHYARLGGTFLGTAREPDFAGKIAEALGRLEEAGVTHLLVLGGNGSLMGAAKIAETGFPVAGIPCTIDNDLAGSEESVGFDTAVNSGLALLDGMRDTAEALPRLLALETLGGNTGFLAQAVAEAGAADVLLVPERPLESAELESQVRSALEAQRYTLIVASEGYPALEETLNRLEAATGLRLRFSRIGHAQRGGRPSGRDRALALALAETAIHALAQNTSGWAAWQAGQPRLLSFSEVGAKIWEDKSV